MKFYQTTSFNTTIKKILKVSKSIKVPAVLIGGNAIDMYVNPPVTRDIDMMAYVTQSQQIRAFTEGLMISNMQMIAYQGSGTEMEIIYKDKNKIKADIIFSKDSIAKDVVESANYKDSIPVASIEWLIMLKLLAYTDPQRQPHSGAKDKKSINQMLALKELYNKKTLLKIAKKTMNNEIIKLTLKMLIQGRL